MHLNEQHQVQKNILNFFKEDRLLKTAKTNIF